MCPAFKCKKFAYDDQTANPVYELGEHLNFGEEGCYISASLENNVGEIIFASRGYVRNF
jgi:hypothetical protein